MYWKKRLVDVRELLKEEALEKLKLSCPTLFALGWFKVRHYKEVINLNILMIIIRKTFPKTRRLSRKNWRS